MLSQKKFSTQTTERSRANGRGDLPGVLKLGHAETKKKRKYVTLRIPERIVKAQHTARTREGVGASNTTGRKQ